MKKIYFEKLQIAVPSNGYTFCDEECVDFIDEAIDKICSLHGCVGSSLFKSRENMKGGCLRINKDIHIFYLERSSYAEEIKVRAHEETHAVDNMKGLEYLSRAMFEKQNLSPPGAHLQNPTTLNPNP